MKTMTNGDKIRQMSDGELYDFLIDFQKLNGDMYSVDTLCTEYKDTGRCLKFDEMCDKCLKSWLREEAREDGQDRLRS